MILTSIRRLSSKLDVTEQDQVDPFLFTGSNFYFQFYITFYLQRSYIHH